jgi:hypothetical protein
MTKHPKPAVLTVVAVTAYAVAAYIILVPLVDPCGWFRADAQVLPAPTGHRQPTPADVAKIDPSQKNPTVSPADRALDRALNNICRGCSPTVAVGKVSRYDVAVTCDEPARDGQHKDACRKDEEEACNQLNKQWTQFTKAGRSLHTNHRDRWPAQLCRAFRLPDDHERRPDPSGRAVMGIKCAMKSAADGPKPA